MAAPPVKKDLINSVFDPMDSWAKTFDSRLENNVSLLWGKLFDTSSKKTDLPGKIWGNGIFVFFIILIIFCFCFAASSKVNYGLYTSTADSVKQLLTIRRETLGSITSNPSNKTSVCLNIKNKVVPYSTIGLKEIALVNWRPLTVRLAGYLGGINGPYDGVFDMDFGISNAIFLGARSFIFDIDYDDNYPCAPILFFQDSSGIKRSLNTGSIKDGMTALSKYAFGGDISNYDPVIVVLYIRRVPSRIKQKSTFYKSIAEALSPLSFDHLGSTEQGTFHYCMAENILFTSRITNFQKKFIVLSNHNSTDLPEVKNPKENLDFWTNARLHIDPMGKSANLSNVVPFSDPSTMKYATIGDASQLLLLSTEQMTEYSNSRQIYKIAISPVEDLNAVMTVANISVLLNTMGVNLVPLDVLNLGASSLHLPSIVNPVPNTLTLANLANGTSSATSKDPISFWSYAGWSRKLTSFQYVETFANYVEAKPIPGFTIPTSAVPKKPSPSTNSNGGLVSIA